MSQWELVLTPAQMRVYVCLVRLTRDGWPASTREVAEAAGYASVSSAHHHLLWLASHEFVRSKRKAGWLPGPRVPRKFLGQNKP